MAAIPEMSVLQWLEQEYEKVALDAIGQEYADPKLPHGDAMLHALQRRIDDLESQLRGYINSQALSDLFSGPMREIIVAKRGSTTKQFQQRALENGALVDFTGGLNVTNDTDPGAAVTLDSDHYCILRTYDTNGKALRNVIISGTTASDVGQYQFMVKSMLSNNSAGWDFVRAAPPII